MELGGTQLVVLIAPQNTSEELNSSVSVHEIMTRLLKIIHLYSGISRTWQLTVEQSGHPLSCVGHSKLMTVKQKLLIFLLVFSQLFMWQKYVKQIITRSVTLTNRVNGFISPLS